MLGAFRRSLLPCPRGLGMSLGVLTALALAASPALGQGQPYGFVYLMSGDTLGVERVTLMGGGMIGDIQMRGQPRQEWTAVLTGPGQFTSLAISAYKSAAADAPLLQRATLALVDDSVRADVSGPGGPASSQRLATRRNALLLVNASAAMVDLALDRARATPSPYDTIPVFLVTGGQTLDSYLHVWGDSALWMLGGQEMRLILQDGHVREAIVSRQNLRMKRVDGAAYAALRMGGVDYSAPAGAPYTAASVRVPATGGHDLAGTLTLPTARTGRVPAVVTITGSGPQDRDEYIPLVPGYRPFRQLADTLGRHGIAVLRYDDRGTGESGGTFAGSTSADFASDVASAVRWLRARPEIDPARIFLVGHSEGGLIAPMVAADDPRLAGIVLLAGPARNGLDIIKFQQRFAIEHDSSLTSAARRDSAITAANTAVNDMARQDKWMAFFFTYDPIPTAKRVKVPTFIVQGGTDQQVTPEQADMLAAALKAGGNTNVSVRVFPERNHLFLPDASGNPANYTKITNGHIGADVVGPVVEWLVRHSAR